tara:strand:+ start:1380 stop:2273 length:894 start_codon:yes stop_codon:yes gene_type:complete
MSTIKAYLKQQLNCSGPDALRIKRRARLFNQRTALVRVDDGAISMHASGGDPLSAIEMKRIFDLAVEAEAHKDFETRRNLHGNDALDHPMPRSSEQRRFDAIHAIFMASVTAAADGKRPEPLVNIIIDAATGLEVVARHGFLDLTTNDLTTNDLTSKVRHAAQLLAVQCGFRNCDVPAEFCDVDHIEPWIHGSETNQANSMPLCGTHDRRKHTKQLRGRRDRHGRIHLITPNGTVIKLLNTPEPEPEPQPQPQPQRLRRHRRYTWDQWVTKHPKLTNLPVPPHGTTFRVISNLRPAA